MRGKNENGSPGIAANREKVRFASDDTELAAWHYPGTNGACVIMAAGGAVNKEPGTDPFAKPFNDDGFTVLAFDYRRFGESGGHPRQIITMKEQLADWQAAIAFAATLPGVSTHRIAVWGFSLSGGHIFTVAARNPGLASAIAQTPLADGPVAARAAARHQKPLAALRTTTRGVLDALGGLLGRPALLVPLAGRPGTVAMLTTPDSQDDDRALNPGNAYPEWRQEVAARSALAIGLYRPGRDAAAVRCPLLVVVCDQDQVALPGPAIAAATRAPAAELVRLPGGHYEPFLDGHQQAVNAEIAFLRQHLLGSGGSGDRPGAPQRAAVNGRLTARPDLFPAGGRGTPA